MLLIHDLNNRRSALFYRAWIITLPETLTAMRSHLFLYLYYTLQKDFCQLLYLNNLTFGYCYNRAQRLSFESKQTNK